jgi:hypothetical protein
MNLLQGHKYSRQQATFVLRVTDGSMKRAIQVKAAHGRRQDPLAWPSANIKRALDENRRLLFFGFTPPSAVRH